MKLYTKTALLIGSVFLAFALAAITLLYISESRYIAAEGMAEAEMLNRAAFEVLYASMRQGGGRQHNRAVVARLRQIEGLHELRLIHGPPVDRQFGVEADEQPQDDLDRRALAGETVQAVQMHDGVRVVRYVTPVFVETECQACHQAEVGEVNGAISVHISLAASDRALAARRNALLGGAVAGLLGLGLATFWGVQRMVVRPVQRIQTGAAALAAGDLEHRLGMADGDEIGALSRAFNGMAARVQASHEHLEDQVRERTQALLALNAVLTATSASLNLDEVYRAFAEEIRKIVDFDRTSITVFEPGGRAYTAMVVATREKTEIGPGFRVERTPTMEWIIAHQRPRIDADLSATLKTGLTTVTDSEPVAERLVQEGIRSWMLMPIIFREEVVGTINFASRKVGAYTQADGERLLPIARQLGVALENSRLYEAEKRRAAHLALLNEVGHEVLATLHMDELLRRVAEAVWRRFGYYNVSILLLDPETGELAPRAMAGIAQELIPPDARGTIGHGVMGHVAMTGKTHLANDVTRDPYYFGLPGLETRAELCVPIKVGGEVVGVLNVESREKGAFDEMDVRAMETLATQLAAALENTRLFRAEREQRNLAETLRDGASTLSSTLDLAEVLERLLESLSHTISYDSAAVFLAEGDALQVVAGRGFADLEAVLRLRVPLADDELFARIARTHRPLVLADARQNARFFGYAGTTYVRGWIGVPLISRGEVIGMLTVDSRTPQAFGEREAEIALTFAGQAAIAIENARLFGEVQRLSLTNDLTGLANRRAFDARLAEEIRRARRYERPLALVMADIDHFKHYNDTHGHPQGDVVLRELASVLRGAVRETDFVARYGGEEFVAILPETDRANALIVAEKIRAAVATHPFPLRESQPGGCLTISLGVATFPEDLPEPAGLVQHADDALYRAKREGRDRVSSYQ